MTNEEAITKLSERLDSLETKANEQLKAERAAIVGQWELWWTPIVPSAGNEGWRMADSYFTFYDDGIWNCDKIHGTWSVANSILTFVLDLDDSPPPNPDSSPWENKAMMGYIIIEHKGSYYAVGLATDGYVQRGIKRSNVP